MAGSLSGSFADRKHVVRGCSTIDPDYTPSCHTSSTLATLGGCLPSSHKSSREAGLRGKELGGPCHPQGVLPQNLDGSEQNRIVTCMVLKAKANDRRKTPAPSREP
ncbi:hypothetical protein TNCV_2631701 [Trichonephila clavipes]|nr:hypothetical protein TNCV_2631701 [Trichonephila clavipes]